jgi:alkylated DNA repair dioxygenase AlkB
MNFDLFDDLEPIQDDLPFKLPDSPLYSYTKDEGNNAYFINIPNGKIMYYPSFFEQRICNRTIAYFLENETKSISHDNCKDVDPQNFIWRNINWLQSKMNIFGKSTLLPRLSAWYGDDDKSYTYSGIRLEPNQWNNGLLYIKSRIESTTSFSFNSVLLNWYRDGNDSISWHTDAEQELGLNPIIGSVSFGETRRFILRRIDKNNEKVEIPLKNGSLLIMYGEMQHFWQHSIPKQKNITNLRFNLTFRNIKR